jgi:hypothetical protein
VITVGPVMSSVRLAVESLVASVRLQITSTLAKQLTPTASWFVLLQHWDLSDSVDSQCPPTTYPEVLWLIGDPTVYKDCEVDYEGLYPSC